MFVAVKKWKGEIFVQKENQLLRARIRSNSRKSPRKKIKGISDLRQSFGLELKVNSNDENEDEISLGTNEKEEEFQKLKKAKMDSEITFHKLQNNIIGFYKEIYKQKTYIKIGGFSNGKNQNRFSSHVHQTL